MSITELKAVLDRARQVDESAGPLARNAEGSALRALIAAIDAARVAEQAGGPVAWRTLDDPPEAGEWLYTDNPAEPAQHGDRYQPLYTTPPSADALVEALQNALVEHGDQKCAGCKAIDAALAKHKENSR